MLTDEKRHMFSHALHLVHCIKDVKGWSTHLWHYDFFTTILIKKFKIKKICRGIKEYSHVGVNNTKDKTTRLSP